MPGEGLVFAYSEQQGKKAELSTCSSRRGEKRGKIDCPRKALSLCAREKRRSNIHEEKNDRGGEVQSGSVHRSNPARRFPIEKQRITCQGIVCTLEGE